MQGHTDVLHRIIAVAAMAAAAVLVGVPVSLMASEPAIAADSSLDEPIWRQPVGIASAPDGRFLYVANRKSGSVTVVDIATEKVAARFRVGGRPEGLARAATGRLAIPDSQLDRLVVLDVHDAELRAHRTIATGAQPMQSAISSGGERAWVSLRLDRAIEAFDLDSGKRLYRKDLAFPPHCLALSADEKLLLAADAFAGNIVALDAATGETKRHFDYPGTNIRGLAFSPDSEFFYFTHQILSEKSIITRDAVFWGALLTNNLRRVSVASFLDHDANPLRTSRLHYLGDANLGAGDPSAIGITNGGLLILCLAGVDEIAIDREWPFSFRRFEVGKRPWAIAIGTDDRRAFVANASDDTVSVVDLSAKRVAGSIPLGPKPKLTAAMRGEILFHDASLSLDGWFSCHSCHTDGHTNGASADTIGDDSYGAPKNIPSLMGVAHTKPWAWTGRFGTLEDQLKSSITQSMQGSAPSKQELGDLVAYLGTLEPRARPPIDAELVSRGRLLFERLDCKKCHPGPNYTTAGVFNVGLDDGLAGNKEFNPPSLLGVGQTAPYFHDGRAPSLADVFKTHKHQLDEPLPDQDLKALIAFLESL